MGLDFSCKKPCSNCPYRKDAPKAHWDISEFIRLLDTESDQLGTVFGCHKNNGTVCAGWMIHQINNNLPSIALRYKLMKMAVTSEELEQFSSPHEMYEDVREMCEANFPELKDYR
jgi:hypothetical protein